MQKRRMKKSLKALKKPEVGRIFVAGEFWEDGEELSVASREMSFLTYFLYSGSQIALYLIQITLYFMQK
jgi:hypothetical protein